VNFYVLIYSRTSNHDKISYVTVRSSPQCIWTSSHSSNLVNVQWIPKHVDLEGNTEADLEAKRGTTLLKSSAPMARNSACTAFKQHQQCRWQQVSQQPTCQNP